jgi:hypothetical protein
MAGAHHPYFVGGTDRAALAWLAMARRRASAANPGGSPVLLLSDRAAVPNVGRARCYSHCPARDPCAIDGIDRSAHFCSPSGVKAVALSTFVIIPLCSLFSLAVVWRFLKFDWLELAATIGQSTAATLVCAIGPLALMLTVGSPEEFSIPLVIVAGALAGIGWIAGLWLTGHPLLQEMVWLSANLRIRIALN